MGRNLKDGFCQFRWFKCSRFWCYKIRFMSWDWLKIGRACVSAVPWHSLPPQSILHKLWLQVTFPAHDGRASMRDILATLLYSGRKQTHFIYLFIQSLVITTSLRVRYSMKAALCSQSLSVCVLVVLLSFWTSLSDPPPFHSGSCANLFSCLPACKFDVPLLNHLTVFASVRDSSKCL